MSGAGLRKHIDYTSPTSPQQERNIFPELQKTYQPIFPSTNIQPQNKTRIFQILEAGENAPRIQPTSKAFSINSAASSKLQDLGFGVNKAAELVL